MNVETVVAVIAAVVAVATLPISLHQAHTAKQQARIAERQTELQQEIAETAAQPYVWADIRPSASQGQVMHLVVGNSGSTVAQNVRVSIDPPVEKGRNSRFGDIAQRKLVNGFSSLAPHKTVAWNLGLTDELVNREGPLAHTITIDCEGPHGAVPTLSYVVDLADFKESLEEPEGSLHHVRKAVEGITAELTKFDTPVRVRIENDD